MSDAGGPHIHEGVTATPSVIAPSDVESPQRTWSAPTVTVTSIVDLTRTVANTYPLDVSNISS